MKLSIDRVGGNRSKSRRQQIGMPDRWRVLEKLDPTMTIIISEECIIDGKVCGVLKTLAFPRKSKLEEMRRIYGEDLEVL